MSKTTYMYRKENNLCVTCGQLKPKGYTKVMCEECTKKMSEDRAVTRQWCKDNKICPRCKRNRLFGDEKNCLDCREKMYYVNIASRNNNPNYQEEEKTRRIRRENKRIEQGLCTKCGKRPLVSKVYCEQCLIKHRNRARDKRAQVAMPRYMRQQYGLCYRCGDTLDNETKVCNKCRDELIHNFNSKRGVSDYWLSENKLLFTKKGGRQDDKQRRIS